MRIANAARRRGVTLIEVGVSTALLALALGMVATSLSVLYRVDDRLEDAAPPEGVRLLVESIRTDARAAEGFTLGDGTLSFDGEAPVRYRLVPGSAIRAVEGDDAASRRFRLPDDTHWEIEKVAVAGRTLLRVELFRGEAERVATLDVEIGRDRRAVSGLATIAGGGE